MNELHRISLMSLTLIALAPLLGCGGGPTEVENNCEEHCTWSYGCAAEAAAENEDAPAVGPSFGQDIDSCIDQCVEVSEPIYEMARPCYDAMWATYAGCMTDIPCNELWEEENTVDEYCEDEFDTMEQVCEEHMED